MQDKSYCARHGRSIPRLARSSHRTLKQTSSGWTAGYWVRYGTESEHTDVLQLAEIVGLLQQGVGNLLRETGLGLMQAVMEEEVRPCR